MFNIFLSLAPLALAIIKPIAGLFGKSWLDKIIDNIGRYFNDKISFGAALDIAEIQAEIEVRRTQKELILHDSGWWVTRWMRPFVFYPLALHVVAVAIDSTFSLGWDIPNIPPPYDYFEYAVVLSHFVGRPFEKSARLKYGLTGPVRPASYTRGPVPGKRVFKHQQRNTSPENTGGRRVPG